MSAFSLFTGDVVTVKTVFVFMIGTHFFITCCAKTTFCNLLKSPTCVNFPFLTLPAGCGNSSMSCDMYNAGYHSITNVDYSSVCISKMSARHSDCPGMTWHEMDMCQLTFPDASFDVIVEKAALDAFMVEEKSPHEMSPQTACSIHKALTEVMYC